MATIDHIDNFTLLRILRIVPLSELIPLRVICKKWQTIIETEIISKRTSLQLFRSVTTRDTYHQLVPNDSLEYALHQSYDTLIVPKMTYDCGRFLVRLFPQISRLFLHFTPKPSDAFLLFLNHWKSSLHFLTFYFSYSLENSATQFHLRMLWQCIQSFSHEADYALRHLAITSGVNDVKFPSGNLQPIKTLETLSLFRFGEEDIETLLHGQIGDNIQKLTIEEATISAAMWDYLLKSKPTLKTNLTHLTLKCYDWDNEMGISEEILNIIAINCTAITNLDIALNEKLHIENLAAQLKRFRNLTNLTLRSFNKFIFSDIEPTEDNHDLMVPSITHLELLLRVKLDKCKLLPLVFPSVRQLVIDFSFITCRCVSRQMERSLEPPSASCLQCYQQVTDHLNEAMTVMEKLSCRKLQIRELNNLAD